MKLTRCNSRPSWALVGAAALAILLIASPETLAERSRGRGHERGQGRGHTERARGGGNGYGYGHDPRGGRDRVEGHRPESVRGHARYGHRHGHARHSAGWRHHTPYRTYRPRPYFVPRGYWYGHHGRPFVVPVRIAVVESYRPYFVGRVFFEPHGHQHSVYEFPVQTAAGYVVRPHYYCEGQLYRGSHVAYSDGRLSVAIRF